MGALTPRSRRETIAEQRSVLFEIKHCVNELPNTLGYTWEGGMAYSQRPVVLRDALGQTLNLPLEFCESYDVRDLHQLPFFFLGRPTCFN